MPRLAFVILLCATGCSFIRPSATPRALVISYYSGWFFSKEWRVKEHELVVIERNGTRIKTENLVCRRGLPAAEFDRLVAAWDRIDPRLWTHSVVFPFPPMDDGPSYGIREEGAVMRKCGTQVPIGPMMEFVSAVDALLPPEQRTNFHFVTDGFELVPSEPEKPNNFPQPAPAAGRG